MAWWEFYRRRAALAQHRALAWATISILLANVVLWGWEPFGEKHIGAGLVLILALTLCYLKYRKR